MNRTARITPLRATLAAGVAVTVAVGGLAAAGGASAESKVCRTAVTESAPTFGAATSRVERTVVSAQRRSVKVVGKKVRRTAQGGWRARVKVRASVGATARRPHVVSVPAEVTAVATVTCGDRTVTATRTLPARPSVRTAVTAQAQRTERRTAVRTKARKGKAVRQARRAAVRSVKAQARRSAVLSLKRTDTGAAWVRARDAAADDASRAAIFDAVSVVETELSDQQPT